MYNKTHLKVKLQQHTIGSTVAQQYTPRPSVQSNNTLLFGMFCWRGTWRAVKQRTWTWSLDKVSKGLTSHSTHYKLLQRWFYRSDYPTNIVTALKEARWSSKSSFNPTRNTPACYNNTTPGNCLSEQMPAQELQKAYTEECFISFETTQQTLEWNCKMFSPFLHSTVHYCTVFQKYSPFLFHYSFYEC